MLKNKNLNMVCFLIISVLILTLPIYFPVFNFWSFCYLLVGLQIQHFVANHYHEIIESMISSIEWDLSVESEVSFGAAISGKSYFSNVLSATLDTLVGFFFRLPFTIFPVIGIVWFLFGSETSQQVVKLIYYNWDLVYYIFLFMILVSYLPLLQLLFKRRF